jgi:poly [ADP-ribose] polymerase
VAKVLEHRKFVFCRAGKEGWQPNGSNKVWEIILYDNGDVETRYGKIGRDLASSLKPGVGRKFFDTKIREKTTPDKHYDGDCYHEIQTLDTAGLSGTTTRQSASATELKEIAKKQIASCPVTAKLIEYFTEVNAHNIYHATGGKITYDTSTGVFRTPIGVVVKQNVDDARGLLHNTLAPFVERGDFNNTRFIRALEQYLMLVPKDIGHKFDARAILGTQDQVKEQEDILDALDASIRSIVSGAAKTTDPTKKAAPEPPKLFSVKLVAIDEKKEIERIQRKFDETRNTMHTSSRLRVRNAYSVEIETMRDAFDRVGAKMTNIWELWHGTKASNCLSILKTGFIIPSSNASFCTGRAYGNGVYFSDQSTKSLNYAMNYWGGQDEGRYFMFLNQVAMGNYMVPRGTTSSNPPSGYDSYFAKAGKSGVVNNEMIVFKTSQINPVRLIEFGR